MADGTKLDPRRHAYRGNLAAAALLDRIDAPRFVEGRTFHVATMRSPVRRSPQHDAPLDTEALYGETLTVYDEANGWSWVQLDGDGYVGYMPSADLSPEIIAPTHRVSAVLVLVYSDASALSAPLAHLSFNSKVRVAGYAGEFARLESGGFVGRRHLCEIELVEPDYVDNALRFIGLPYLFGGKSAFGLDCSGLVQIVLQAAGIEAPRDSDMQLAEVVPKVDIGPDLAGLQRGDLVFWTGHVGIMIDATMMVHASAANMSVALEPVCDVAERSRQGGPVIAGVSRPGLKL